MNPKDIVGKIPKEKLLQLKAKWATDLGLGGNPVAQFGSPVSFTAHLDNLLPGQTVPLSTSGLANGYRTPYIIDEIHMQAYMTTPAASANLVQPSYAVGFQFRTGAYAFSERPVPMMLYQPVYANVNPIGNVSVAQSVLKTEWAGAVITIGDEARWTLAKPLWMAPGDQIQASVSRDATAASLNNSPFSVDVTYIGRSLKPGTPGPKKRYVPWAAHYVHLFSDAWSSTTTQFRNPFMHPLTVQQLIGRPAKNSEQAAFATGRVGMLPNASAHLYAGIYIEDSLGYKITRSAIDGNFAPVGTVFDTERCAWTFARPLGPREQLNMQFQTLGTVDPNLVDLFGVSMLGYREEQG